MATDFLDFDETSVYTPNQLAKFLNSIHFRLIKHIIFKIGDYHQIGFSTNKRNLISL